MSTIRISPQLSIGIRPPIYVNFVRRPPAPEQVAVILAENVVMHSPVLIKPIIDRELVAITVSFHDPDIDKVASSLDKRLSDLIEKGEQLI